ncbi:MAG: SRPBCC family protein [Proteobacteria bacterium]|nr:SRPBCC family protein [Pseudomonadota bacterium]MBS0547714.1 SRPBCC family protein [Pseudomonadota bacterium]
MTKSTFNYVTYIRTTPERLWEALTTPAFIQQYWFGMNVTGDFTKGAKWKLSFTDGRVADEGEIVESDPPRKLAIRWQNRWKPEMEAEGLSLCTFTIEPQAGANPPAVKLSVLHSMERDGSKFIEAVSGGWPAILSNLKSLLETGTVAIASMNKG